MSHEQVAAIAITNATVEPTILPPADATVPAPTPEEVHAADTVFVPAQEANTAANLFGIWTSLVLLRDLAIENFTAPPEEPRLRKEDKDEQPE
jgi:hypothetical protein